MEQPTTDPKEPPKPSDKADVKTLVEAAAAKASEALPETEGVSDDEAKYRAEMVHKFCESANVHLACEGYASPQNRAIVKAVILAMIDTRP